MSNTVLKVMKSAAQKATSEVKKAAQKRRLRRRAVKAGAAKNPLQGIVIPATY